MKQYKKEFIEFMIQSGVLTFGDFVTKSGRKTPFFINTGNYNTGEQLSVLGDFYAKAIYENFGKGFNVLFGPAYKGIPLSVSTAISLNNLFGINVSYCSSRKEIKDHGDKGILLGAKIKSGSKVLIIEDVTTAGTSIYETMPIIKAQGDIDVMGLIISVDRMERGKGDKTALKELEEQFGFATCSIVTMEEVINYLYNRKLNDNIVLDKEIKLELEKYYEMYGVI